MNERVCVAQFGAAHGVRGELRLRSFTQDPMAFTSYGPLETEDRKRTVEIETARAAKDHLVVRVAGIADRDAAEALRNVKLYVAREKLPPVEDNEEFYHADLIGLAAIDESGEAIGTVAAVHNFGAGDVIEIKPPSGEPMLLPFTDQVVPNVDLQAKHITIVLPQEIDGDERDGKNG